MKSGTSNDEETAKFKCLEEGIDIIFNKIEELNIPFNSICNKKSIKRIDKALLKYLKERFEAMLYDVRFEKAKA